MPYMHGFWNFKTSLIGNFRHWDSQEGAYISTYRYLVTLCYSTPMTSLFNSLYLTYLLLDWGVLGSAGSVGTTPPVLPSPHTPGCVMNGEATRNRRGRQQKEKGRERQGNLCSLWLRDWDSSHPAETEGITSFFPAGPLLVIQTTKSSHHSKGLGCSPCFMPQAKQQRHGYLTPGPEPGLGPKTWGSLTSPRWDEGTRTIHGFSLPQKTAWGPPTWHWWGLSRGPSSTWKPSRQAWHGKDSKTKFWWELKFRELSRTHSLNINTVAAFEGYTGIWQLDKNKSPDRDKQSAWCRTENHSLYQQTGQPPFHEKRQPTNSDVEFNPMLEIFKNNSLIKAL